MKRLLIAIISLVAVGLMSGAAAGPAYAQIDVFPQCGGGQVDSQVCTGSTRSLFGAGSTWNKILNAVTYVAGGVAVLMIIVGGLRYTLSNGDQSNITAAKNTILYAIVGLVVSLMANAIVNFVIARL